MKLEHRDIEARFATDDAGTISGYAAVWGKRDSFGDILLPGTFAASIVRHRSEGTRPLMLWSHDPAAPVGVWNSVEEDARGLKVSGRLVLDATGGRDAHALLKAGALDGLSIGFRTVKAQSNPKGGRTLSAADLIEVSLVARPAQSAARVTTIKSAASAPPAAAGLAALIRASAAKLERKAP